MSALQVLAREFSSAKDRQDAGLAKRAFEALKASHPAVPSQSLALWITCAEVALQVSDLCTCSNAPDWQCLLTSDVLAMQCGLLDIADESCRAYFAAAGRQAFHSAAAVRGGRTGSQTMTVSYTFAGLAQATKLLRLLTSTCVELTTPSPASATSGMLASRCGLCTT